MIDFGMIDTVDARTQEQLTRVVMAVMGTDTEQLSASRAGRRLERCARRPGVTGDGLAQQLQRILSDLEWGDLAVSARPEKYEPLMRRFEQLANRIVLGILAAAFIVGLAVLLAVYHSPGIERWAGVLFAIGFIAATALGVYQAWNILRAGRG